MPRSEDTLVAELRALIESKLKNRRVLNAIGDDAAVWQPSRSSRSVVTTDTLVEGVHFNRDTMPLSDAGWRAMASNVSDLAAMGARPVLATIALGVSAETSRSDVIELYDGMLEAAAAYDCEIAGGDVTRAPSIVVSITAIGEVRPRRVKRRGGARPGDVIAVTGALGASRAGLQLALGGVPIEEKLAAQALAAHRRPQARVAEGRWLAASDRVHAMMDISDGLSTDLTRMCKESGCAAEVDDVPVAPSAAKIAQVRGEDPFDYALAGGEDYELLVAIEPRAFGYLCSRFAKRFGNPLHRVGQFREGSGAYVRKAARLEPLTPTGWDHLA